MGNLLAKKQLFRDVIYPSQSISQGKFSLPLWCYRWRSGSTERPNDPTLALGSAVGLRLDPKRAVSLYRISH